MEMHPVFGIAVPEKGWVPSPRYLLRRDRVLKLLEGLPRGSLLEIGCGAGALIKDLAQLGFRCLATDISPAACELARHIHRHNPNVEIVDELDPKRSATFDYVLALEVLEHIEDDVGALRQWARWLKPSGSLVLSVPAHPWMWNASDVWAGHFRRYEREGLEQTLQQAGFSIVHLESWGFPLANMIEPLRALKATTQPRRQTPGAVTDDQLAANTARSGIERSWEVKLYPLQASWIGTKLIQLNFLVQGLFSGRNWGNAYLVMARSR